MQYYYLILYWKKYIKVLLFLISFIYSVLLKKILSKIEKIYKSKKNKFGEEIYSSSFFSKFMHCLTSNSWCSLILQTILYLSLVSRCLHSSQIILSTNYGFIAKSIMLNGSPSFLGADAPIPKADLANSLFILFETSANIILYAVHWGSTAFGVWCATTAL